MIAPAEQRPELDKYEVREEIGHGGMATVYRARDRRLGRDVAVKVIHRHLRENLEVAARFVSEARAVAKLKHPNIVEVYDVSDEADAERYLVVELVEGTTVRKLLTERGHMPAEVAAAVGLEIAAGLEQAHAHGVIHRDVKPENVLVSLRSPPTSTRESQERPSDATIARIKIADFGIAKLLDAQGVTSTGQVLGSPAHMAPEQIEGGEVSARADVFGVGVMLYECMVGRLPFDGKNPAQVLRKVLDGTFTPPERARPTVGTGLSRVVEKALARDAADRWESADALADALRAELDRLGFKEPRCELADWLANPEAYTAEYEKRVVAKLVELGKKARANREVQQAAQDFNRALAFRPDDTELLQQVAGLARSERIKRVALRGGVIALASVTLGAAAYGITRAAKPPKLEAMPENPVDRTPLVVDRPKQVVLDSSARPGPSAVAPDDAKRPVTSRPAVPVGPVAPQPTRRVKILVQGAQGGTVKVDGAPVEWFATHHELTVGMHTFEFSPPNETCCVVKAPYGVEIVAGDGVQTVVGSVPFKDAFVALSGPPEAEATCSMLFSGVLKGGAQRRVRIPGPKPEVRGSCSITGPGGEIKAVDLALLPGRTFTVTWP